MSDKNDRGKNVEFDVQSEQYSEYEIDGGTALLRAKPVITHVFDPGEGKVNVAWMWAVSVIAHSPRSRGTPTPPENNPTAAKVPVDFTPISEPFNSYATRGPNAFAFRTRLALTDVSRCIDCFDQQGEPAYLVNGSIVVSNPVKQSAKLTR